MNRRFSAIVLYPFKGQLILKCLFGFFNSPKKQTKQFDLRSYSKVEVFCLFLRELKIPKTFRN